MNKNLFFKGKGMNADIKTTEKYQMMKRDLILINSVSGCAIGILLLVIVLQRRGVLPGVPCAVHDIFHIYCPGCGGTRAFFELLHGRILRSLYYNPAVFLGALLILYYEIGALITLFRKDGKCYYDQKAVPVYGYMLILIIYTVVRDYLLVGMGIDMIGDFYYSSAFHAICFWFA